LHLAAALALLQQKLAAGSAFPERLIDLIDFRKTFCGVLASAIIFSFP
jgi:hypothetical protein